MRYFFGFMVALGLIILVIFLIVTSGGKPKVATTHKTLDSYAFTNAEASMTIDGPVNANSLHQRVKVTVDRDNVTLERGEGYDGNVVSTVHFANTENAYNTFLLALAHAGYARGNLDSKLSDERGYCPLGNRTIFELKQDDKKLERFWATSCGNPKTYLGSLGLTTALFKAQVPSYQELTRTDKL